MAIQMTRAEYEAKYGKAPTASSTPIKMTRAEYEAKYSTPKAPTIAQRVQQDFSKRSSNVAKAKANVQAGKQTLPEGILQSSGQVAGFAGDLIGQGLGAAFRALPDRIETPIREAGSSAIASVLGTQTAQQAIRTGQEFTEKYPRTSSNLGATLNIGSIIPVAGVTGVAVKSAKETIPVIKEGVSTAVKQLTKRSEDQIEKAVLNRFEKGVKPLLPGKTTLSKAKDYRVDVVNAVRTINQNKDNLTFTDDVGEVIIGRNPKSLKELSEALDQTKSFIYGRYDDLAKSANEKGLTVRVSTIAPELDDVITNKALQITNPTAIKYAENLRDRLSSVDEIDAKTAQEVIQNYNKSLEAFYRNPSYDSASQAAIDAMIANRLRKTLDEGISGLTGQQYQALKSQYGALKTIERDVVKAALRDARKNNVSLIDYTDIFTSGDIIQGLISMNPAAVARGTFSRGVKEFYKFLNDPNRAIDKMFRVIEKSDQSLIPNNQRINSSGGGKNLLQNQPAVNSAITPNINPNITPTLPQASKTSSKLDKFGNNSQAGFAALTYKGEKDLTTKILKDLEGKTTVSKQYILDATNRGELKQVERDLIREALETEKDVVNVADFAKKVKAELLPLKVKGSDTVNPKFDQYSSRYMQDEGSFSTKYDNIALPDELRGKVANYRENIYESPIATSAGDVHFGYTTKNYFGHTRIEDMADNQTRRVIEVQSDLYQKGNLEKEIPKNDTVILRKLGLEKEHDNLLEKVADGKATARDKVELNSIRSEINKVKEEGTKNVSKLQQYNDPTAHFRMIREEIKKASQDGKTKLQFPTGETAMKIEGLGQADTNWRLLYEDIETPSGMRPSGSTKLKPENISVGDRISDSSDFQWIITENLGEGKFKAVPNRQLEFENVEPVYKRAWDKKYIDHDTGDWDMEKVLSDKQIMEDMNKSYLAEQFDISGKVDTNNPIYRFYEKDVQKYLNKFGGKRVVDDKGVQWIEVPITKDMADQAVEAFGKIQISPLFGIAGATAGAAGAKVLYDKKKNANLPKKK